MMKDNYNENFQNDFISVNSDYTGLWNLADDKKEVVEFHNNSSVRIWYNEQNIDYETHWHDVIEIITPVENYYDVTIAGADYHLIPGDILLIPPGELHSLTAPASGKRFIFLYDIAPLRILKGFSGIQSLLMQPLYVTADSYPNIYEDVYQLLIQMRNEYFNKNEYAELAIYSLLINLLLKFGYNRINTTNLFPNVRLYKQKEYVQKFNNLMDYIDTHYAEEISLEEMADTIGFSKYHFARLFKQYTNYTFCDYICYRRIKAAEKLLTEPDLSITEIAFQSGFSSISTFNRIFKQLKNCTPSEYRSKNHQILPGH